MSEVLSLPRLITLWKAMTPDRKTQAAEAFWRDPNGVSEQAEAIAAIAHRLKFRTKSLVVLPVAKKVHYLLGLPAVPEIVAARLLVSYHIECQRPMMAAFLNSLGIAHEDGLIADETEVPKDLDKIKAAVDAIAAAYPAEDVGLYLTTLRMQDPEAWSGLSELPEARFPLGS